jgi:hypothetical protein
MFNAGSGNRRSAQLRLAYGMKTGRTSTSLPLQSANEQRNTSIGA